MTSKELLTKLKAGDVFNVNEVYSEMYITYLEELELYKKALVLACNEIRDRGCSYYEAGSSYCKANCELHSVCTNNNYEGYFLQKAVEEG